MILSIKIEITENNDFESVKNNSALASKDWYENWYNEQPDGMLYIGKIACGYKGSMPENTTIVLREGTKSIADRAFILCKNLVSVTIPNSVRNIGNAAFLGCKNLINIEIPDSVEVIAPVAFCDTAWFDAQPDRMVYAGKVAYEYKGEMLKNTSVVLRDGTVSIAEEAFANSDGYENLVNIIIPDSVTYIGERQFENCMEDFRKNIIIHCIENSYAHIYALENRINLLLTANDGTIKDIYFKRSNGFNFHYDDDNANPVF